ncbi:MAG: YraN family protein [Blastocatellia bacterium]|nr:YraN family protein [Blastocatellia bacterium]
MTRERLKSETLAPRELGIQGENLAAEYLKRLGFRIVARNVTLPVGRTSRGNPLTIELDIVGFDGDCLVFVEVKTRSSQAQATPAAAITPHKQSYLRKGGNRYRRLIGPFDAPYRFDAVAIVWEPGKPPHLSHTRNFLPEL